MSMKRLLKWNRKHVLMLACLLLPCGAAMMTGCGGGGAATPQRAVQTGTLRLDIDWSVPQASGTRLIPPSANSIVFDLTDSRAKQIGHKVVARPAGQTTTQAVFTDILQGEVLIYANAYPLADGTGTAQANAAARVQVQPGVAVDVTLTLSSRIDHIDITPTNTSIPVGQRASFTATPRDIQGHIIMIAPDALTWNLSDTSIATLATLGAQAILKGQQVGNAVLSVTDNDSGRNGAATINVVIPASPNGTAAIILH